MINTGAPRSITGHFVSGLAASFLLSGAMNYQRMKEGELDSHEAIFDTAKKTIQGGIVTACSIATANYLGTSEYFKALSALSIGALCVYGVQKSADSLMTSKEALPHKQ